MAGLQVVAELFVNINPRAVAARYKLHPPYLRTQVKAKRPVVWRM